MAEVDTRVESLEDEIKVLKREVRRTLVDLRALLMREDSPLNEGTFGRSASLKGMEVDGEPRLTRKEVSEMVRLETAEVARPSVPEAPAPNPLPPPNPGNPVPQGATMATPGPAAPGMPFPQSPMGDAGGGFPPPPQAPPSAPQPADPAIAERERKLAEQERRMEEQGRRLAEQEHRITSAARSEDARERDPVPPAVREVPVQNLPEPLAPRAETEERRDTKESRKQLEQEQQTAPDQDLWNEDHGPEEVTRPLRRPPNSVPGTPVPSDEAEDGVTEQLEALKPVRSRDNDTLGNDTERVVRRRPQDKGSPPKREPAVFSEGESEAARPQTIPGNGRGNRVYDEYRELLGETEELDAADDGDSVPFPLDINLLSSLTRWTSVARNRVGEQRLIEILNLYSQSGHLSESLRDLLGQISGMVGGAPPETNEDAQGFVDLIFHLHGILAGGLAIPQIQQVKPPN